MKKRIAGIMAVFAVVGILGGCQKAAVQDNIKSNLVIRLAHQPGHTQPLIAREKGFFEEEFLKDGITVELKQFASGPPIIEAFAAGEVDFGLVGDQPAVQGKANNLPLKIIGSYGSTEKGNALVASSDSGIKTLSDIKGKKIGYTAGSVGHQLLLKFLEAEGLTVNDAELLNLSPGDIYTSLESGSIDAGVTWEPYITKSVSSGVADVIQDGTGYKYNVNVIIADAAFLEKNPEISARLLKVLNRAAKWANEHEEESLDILAKASGLDSSAFAATFEKFDRSLFLDQKKIDSIKETADYLRKQGTIRSDVDIDSVIDLSFLKAAGITE